jgi:hypothetical protein
MATVDVVIQTAVPISQKIMTPARVCGAAQFSKARRNRALFSLEFCNSFCSVNVVDGECHLVACTQSIEQQAILHLEIGTRGIARTDCAVWRLLNGYGPIRLIDLANRSVSHLLSGGGRNDKRAYGGES